MGRHWIVKIDSTNQTVEFVQDDNSANGVLVQFQNDKTSANLLHRSSDDQYLVFGQLKLHSRGNGGGSYDIHNQGEE